MNTLDRCSKINNPDFNPSTIIEEETYPDITDRPEPEFDQDLNIFNTPLHTVRPRHIGSPRDVYNTPETDHFQQNISDVPGEQLSRVSDWVWNFEDGGVVL